MRNAKSENTEVTTSVFGGNVSIGAIGSLADDLDAMAAENPRGSDIGDSLYLNFSGKRGIYELGPDKDEVDEDDLWLVNIASFELGYICWKGGSPVALRLAGIGQAPVQAPDPQEGGPFEDGDGWKVCKTMMVRNVDTGVQAYFKTSSVSGVDTLTQLQKAAAKQDRGGAARWPIITMSMEKFGKHNNYKPAFTIEGWISDEQIGALSEDSDFEELMAENTKSKVAAIAAKTDKKKSRRNL